MSKLKYFDGTNWNIVNGQIVGDTLPIGSIIPYGSTVAPTGWLVCDGSAVSRNTYSELFATLGTSYGIGDGTTTFNLPNLKGRVPVGYNSSDTDFDFMGEYGGEKKHTLTINEMPSHNHSQSLNGGSGGNDGNAAYDWSVPQNRYTYSGIDLAIKTGGDQPHNNLQPYQVVCYIIKVKQSAGLVANVSNINSNSTTDTYSCDYINDTIDGIIASGGNTNGYYTKYADGTLICRYYVGPLTIGANSGATQAVTFPTSFVDTNWQCMIQLTNGQNYWSWIATAVKSKTATGFTLDIWNNSEGQCPGQYFDYIAIGRWK